MFYTKHTTARHGFTLIEIMVAISISALLFGVGAVRYIDFNRTQTIKGVGLVLKNNLRDVQAKSMAGLIPPSGCPVVGEEFDGYVMHWHDNEYRQYISCNNDWDNGDTPLVTISLPSTVRLGTTDNPTTSPTFNASQPGDTRFNNLGLGANVNTIVTLEGQFTPRKYYSLCISLGGDIKECGYSSGNPPICRCP